MSSTRGRKELLTTGRRCIACVLLPALFVTGCYTTTPLGSLSPGPSTRIVANLTRAGAEEMAPMIGADAVSLEAEVLGRQGSRWELSVLRVDHRGAPSIRWNGETVLFPEEVLTEIRERSLDVPRTVLFIGGVTAAATALALSFLRFTGTGDGGGGGGEPPN